MRRIARVTFGVLLAAGSMPSPAFASGDCGRPMYPEEARYRPISAPMPSSEVASYEQNGITYVNGGVADERQVLERMSSRYNLKLTMATPCGRLSAAPLRIEDGQGRILVDAPDAGPMFLAKMPAGNYTLRVSPADGQPLTKTVSVPSNGQRQVVLTIPERSEQ